MRISADVGRARAGNAAPERAPGASPGRISRNRGIESSGPFRHHRRMDDDCRMAGLDGRALVEQLVHDIALRDEDDEDGVLLMLLSSAWPTRRSQIS